MPRTKQDPWKNPRDNQTQQIGLLTWGIITVSSPIFLFAKCTQMDIHCTQMVINCSQTVHYCTWTGSSHVDIKYTYTQIHVVFMQIAPGWVRVAPRWVYTAPRQVLIALRWVSIQLWFSPNFYIFCSCQQYPPLPLWKPSCTTGFGHGGQWRAIYRGVAVEVWA